VKKVHLENLSNIQAISGFEDDVIDYVKDVVKKHPYEYKEDFMKNLIVFIPGKSHDFKLGIFAHTDEVGLMVTKIKDDHTLKFTSVGGVDPRVLAGKKVRVGEKTKGVIGFKPIHLQKKESLSPSFDNLSIFVEKSSNVKAGDPVFFTTKFHSCGNFYIGKAFDDRVGCAIMLELIEREEKPPFDLYLSFVSQEEVGLRGSAVAAANLDIDMALVVEGTTAGDNPELEESHWATHVGNGPVLIAVHSGYVIDKRIFEGLKKVAEEKNIPYQVKRRTAGGTDAARIARTFSGIPTGVVSVASRYIHSPVSLIAKEDFENTFELVKAFVESEVLTR
jgi:putative aminopeptidase FrvX